MKRRTLLAAAGASTLLGGAGCFGIAAMTDDDQENSDGNSNSSENASDSSQSDGNTTEGNDTNNETTDQESDASDTENNESEDGDPQADNESTDTDNESSEESTSRPEDPVNTISVRDDGLDVSPSPEKGVDEEIYCYATFDVGEYDLRKVRIDAVALAKDGTRLDHAWKPFMSLEAGETFDVEFRFFVNSDEIYEYLIGATEAQYVDS